MNAFVVVSLLPNSSFLYHRSQRCTLVRLPQFVRAPSAQSRPPTSHTVRASTKSSQTPSAIKDLLQDALEGLNSGLQIDPDAETMDEDEAEVMFQIYCSPVCTFSITSVRSF